LASEFGHPAPKSPPNEGESSGTTPQTTTNLSRAQRPIQSTRERMFKDLYPYAFEELIEADKKSKQPKQPNRSHRPWYGTNNSLQEQ
jgi:hypothetical protein